MERRLQILLDEERYRRIKTRADELGVSVARVIREAIDDALPPDAERKRAALQRILDAEPMPVPEDPRELKREIAEAHDRRER